MCCLRSCICERSCEGLSYHRTDSNRKIAFLGIHSARAIMLHPLSALPGFHLSLLPPEATQFVNILWGKCWKLTNKSSLKCLQLLYSLVDSRWPHSILNSLRAQKLAASLMWCWSWNAMKIFSRGWSGLHSFWESIFHTRTEGLKLSPGWGLPLAPCS